MLTQCTFFDMLSGMNDEMKIGFTGHRTFDASGVGAKLRALAAKYPHATWVLGGAVGFDSFAEQIADECGVQKLVLRPDYASHGRGAPFVRNREIVDKSRVVVTYYDGRTKGGTCYTVRYAERAQKIVWNLCDMKSPTQTTIETMAPE